MPQYPRKEGPHRFPKTPPISHRNRGRRLAAATWKKTKCPGSLVGVGVGAMGRCRRWGMGRRRQLGYGSGVGGRGMGWRWGMGRGWRRGMGRSGSVSRSRGMGRGWRRCMGRSGRRGRGWHRQGSDEVTYIRGPEACAQVVSDGGGIGAVAQGAGISDLVEGVGAEQWIEARCKSPSDDFPALARAWFIHAQIPARWGRQNSCPGGTEGSDSHKRRLCFAVPLTSQAEARHIRHLPIAASALPVWTPSRLLPWAVHR